MRNRRHIGFILAALVVLLIQSAGAAPEDQWLRRQAGVSVLTQGAARSVYRVRGRGEGILDAYRDRLEAQRWKAVAAVYSGPVRHLRLRRDADVVDATLQIGTPASKLTVTGSTLPGHGAIADKRVEGERMQGTYELGGGTFALNGDRADITIEGAVSIVRVNGSHNEIKIDAAAAAVFVRGRDNHVTWRRSRNRLTPVVTVEGPYNVLGGF